MRTGKFFFTFIFAIFIIFAQSEFTKAQTTNCKLVLDIRAAKDKINKEIYGHFAEHLGHCIYEGLYVGENSPIPNTHGIRNDIINALKEMKISVLRWPGGCFADSYHWKDGIGPKDKRPKLLNYFWGQVVEDNSFGSHEFLDLCEILSCEPYISANLGSGTVQEMKDWIEYLTSDYDTPLTQLRKQNGREKPWKVKYWGVGNESWGCGGEMKPEFYSDQFNRYSNYCFNYGNNRLYKIAVGPSGDDYNWTDVVMKNCGGRMNGLGMHYYTCDWNNKALATGFDVNSWYKVLNDALKIDELITRQSTIMDKYDPKKSVGLLVDEWGAWYKVEPGTNPAFLFQQNSLRDALVAGLTLNIFNNHSERVKMANLAQIVNVLQSVILTKGDKIVLTPTYYVFKMYKAHQDAILIPNLLLNCPEYKHDKINMPLINASASLDQSGKINITICNISDDNSYEINIDLMNVNIKNVTGEIITAQRINSFNDFSKEPEVLSKEFKDFKMNKQSVEVKLPSKSVILLQVSQK
jgi:alpha-N-arabinofuranosidase